MPLSLRLCVSVSEESLQRMRTGLGDAGAGDDMLKLRTPPAPPLIMFCNNIKLFSFPFLGKKEMFENAIGKETRT